MEIRQTSRFSDWLDQLCDDTAQAKIAERLRRLARGNPGDTAPVGEGVSELRIHYGPGYRIYFLQCGEVVTILLSGGIKKSQAKDIREAKALAKEIKELNS